MRTELFRLKKVLYLLAPYLLIIAIATAPQQAMAQQPPEPLVAIHVSELTQALETIPAVPPTPAEFWTTGNQWWYTSWRYFVAHESLKEALRSDGTPFIEVSDSDIAAGKLRNPDGSPRYPILISLAAEATADNEIAPLRDYVSAGGFLLVGSSAFTRNPDGSQRGDFALASEMGLHMANASLAESNNWNWYENKHFSKSADHRLTSHIPSGTLLWNAPLTSEQVPYPWDKVTPDSHVGHSLHYAWQVTSGGASILANGDAGPLVTVHNHGLGQVMFHGAMQPLIGHGGYDTSIYAYLIYRHAIEWAFDSFSLPIVKVSPWPYQYDAAFNYRHDFENIQSFIQAIESSAQYDQSNGVKGDYYFSTGALREDMGGDAATVASLRRAVSNYGATIGSHNGGLKNPQQTSLVPADFDYWHWGPDEALDTTPQGYASGKAYASASILSSFLDAEGWLAGLDNGRPGCGQTGNCPRVWVAPHFNATREGSRDIIAQLGVVATGEPKICPFPSRVLSYKTPGKLYSTLALPASDWYVGTYIVQNTDETHTVESIRAAVDFYYTHGALINFYGHRPSNFGSVQQEYVTYSMAKPRIWSTNAVGINDWWRVRLNVAVTPTVAISDATSVVTVPISGVTDSRSAIELILPNAYSGNLQVFFDGSPASSSDYRVTGAGVKIRVDPAVANVMVQYSVQIINTPPVAVDDSYAATANTAMNQVAPGVLDNDADPEGATLTAQLVSGPSHGTLTLADNGSFAYIPVANYVGSDSFTYRATDGNTNSNTATVTITVASTTNVLFGDDFARDPDAVSPLSPWVVKLGTWTVADGTLYGSGPLSSYSSIYLTPTPLWTYYSLEGRVRFPAGALGGGLGGRVDAATGARYGAWVYPDGSDGGSNVLMLVKFRDWTTWNWTPMKQVSLSTVGTGWHALKMVFNGSRIQVYYDGTKMIDVTDNNFDSRVPYASGGISADMYTYLTPYIMEFDNIVVRNLAATVPLLAANDTYSINANTTLNQAVPGVLANDTVPEGTAVAQLVSGPSHGSLTLNSNGSFSYTPAVNYTGSDSFSYKAYDGTTGSNSATVAITVASTLATLELNPATVTGGNISQGTVTLLGPAPTGGAVLQLGSDNTAAGVPTNVTIAAGTNSASFMITTTPVSSSTAVSISALYNGVTRTALLTINPPSLSTLALNPDSVTGGTASQGTVTLNGAAPSGGTVLQLGSDNTAASVPSSVTVATGSTSAFFTIATTAVSSSTAVTISAVSGGVTRTAQLTLTPPTLSAVSVSPTSVTGGGTSQGTVTLNGPAPSGGTVLQLGSDNTAASVPSSVTVATGSTSAFFTIATTAVSSSTAVTISAVSGGVTRTAQLTLTPPTLSAVSVSPTGVMGGVTSQGTVTLSGPAPSGGAVVSLSNNSSASTLPASVTVESGANSATFTITTSPVVSSTAVTISAAYDGVTKTAQLTVTPPALSAVTVSPTSVKGGATSQGTVTLSGPAPSGGAVVTLSDNSSKTSLPSSVTIASGAATATFTITTVTVTSSTTSTISAVYKGVTKKATLTVTR